MFIHVMGIDKGELERIHVTVLIAVPRQTGSDSMEGGSELVPVSSRSPKAGIYSMPYPESSL